MHTFVCRLLSITLFLLLAAGTARAGEYIQSNLVSNIPGMAPVPDPNLQGAWGLSFSTTSPFWISNQASGTATLYKVTNTNPLSASIVPLVVPITNQGTPPAPPNPNTNGPTGQVAIGAPGITTGSMDFLVGTTPGVTAEAHFAFANMDGSISAWGGVSPSRVEATVAGASYTGLAIGNLPGGGAAQLYAADQNSGNIDVFNSKWAMIGKFTDPNGLPAGFNSFNVQNINGLLYVTYTNQSIPTGGIVDVFKPDGTFVSRLINDPTGKWLDNPWGLTIAPESFGKFGGDLLVGNNAGTNWINAFDPTNGDFKGVVTLASGQPFSEGNLWALSFGNGVSAGSMNTLYFTAGLDNNTNGLIGAISFVPEPSSAVLALIAMGVLTGGWRWKNRRRRARS